MNVRRSIAPSLAAVALLLAGCGGGSSATSTPPLQGAAIGGPFTLADQHGRRVTDASFAGRYRIMYFGYTYCPDVCPTDAQAIGAGLKQFEQRHPALGARIVPVFVTVDPARDTPAVLARFVANFHPRMVGLSGTEDQVAAIAKGYGVWFQREKPGSEGAYLVSHSRQTYLMSPDGKPLALVPADKGADAVAADIERWVT
jgi:protein SCO1/2